LKTTFQAIWVYHSKSGCHWDNEHGANIKGPAAEAVWKEYVSKKSNSAMKPFKNNGWPFYSKMEKVLPEKSAAQGTMSSYLQCLI
ncbi:hypothetical protein BDR03DRAFT_869403, partial [Suillus americanus]